MSQSTALAIGIVMHRHSLGAQAALSRLEAQARQEGRTLAAVAERILNAQEVLSGLGPLG